MARLDHDEDRAEERKFQTIGDGWRAPLSCSRKIVLLIYCIRYIYFGPAQPARYLYSSSRRICRRQEARLLFFPLPQKFHLRRERWAEVISDQTTDAGEELPVLS